MAGKLVKRTLDIIKSGVDEKVKDYTSNWTQFTSDAREVKDILIKGETNAADTVQKLKRTGITKKISDWFYGAETEFDASGSDSDFDPGFSVESSSDGKLDGDKSSSALTYDSMKDLSAKQTGMMVKIGRRQTEQSVANTAEVISTINNRTAEMVAVMNNINTSLKGVNDRLDKLIKIQSLGIEAEEERALGGEGGLYDSNGMLSLKGVFDAARTTGSGKFGQALQTLGMAKGNIGPEMLFGLALDTVLGRQRSSLGGKSVNELGKQFNEFIGNGIQTALTNVISSKTFKDLFGDITSFEADKNYGDLRNARYDTKRAQFDNMTRHSIVKIMPELLIKLNENLSGKSYHINQNGDIVEGPAKNYFNEAINSSIGSVNITSRAYSNINQGMRQVFNKEIPKEDIDAAADALLRYYVDYGHRKGSIITKDDIRNASPEAIGTVCDIIGMTNTDSSKGYNYWSKVCQTILHKVTNGNSFDAHAFVNSINQSIRNTQSAAVEQARGFYGDQAGKITLDILKTGYVEKYGSEAQKNQISRSTTTTASKFTTSDYVKGIFAILNRGVNVKIEKGAKYEPITRAEVLNDPWQISSTDNTAAAQLFGALTGDKNAIKSNMESAMGLLGAANNATGGRVGFLQTAANLTTMFNQGKGFFDNIRNRQITNNLVAAIHGDASALKAQVGGKIDQAKNAVVNNLPYGMTHDQRLIDAGQSIQGIGHNVVGHAQNLGHNIADRGRSFVQNTGIGQTGYRIVNNALYGIDDRRLNAARNSISNFNTSGLSARDQRRVMLASTAFEAGNMDKFNRAIGGITDDRARDYLSGKYDVISTINARRTNVQGTPDIGAVRMAAPDKNNVNSPHSPLYKLIKGGFNLTTTILKGLFKLAASGASDVFYGMKSFGWGMFGGKNEDGSRHHGLIENLTFDFARGARNLGVGSLKKARDKWYAGDSGHYKNQRTNDDGSIDFINYTRGEWRDKQKAEGQDLKSRLKGKEFGTDMSVWDALTHPIKAVATAFKDVTEPLRKFTKTVVAGAKSIAGSIADWVKETKLGRAAGWLGNKASGLFTASEFGKGFTKAWREKSEAKKAKQFDAQREESFINSATGKLMDMISGKDTSVLTQLADILKKIELNTLPEEERRNRLEQQNDQQGTDEEGKGEGDTEGDEDENKGKGKGIFGKIKGFFGKKKKNEDPNGSGSAGEGEGGGGTEGEGATAGVPADGGNVGKATKSPGGEGASAGAGSAVGKATNSLSGNVGAILGGIFKSVGGIFKMATSVVLAMEGLETIKTLVTDIFKKGLKPLNQVFQKVYHMIKPLATQLTNIVKDIAKALTQMLDGVLKTLTPLLKMISDAISTIFDTILQPVMEILDATLSACMVPITLCLDAMKPALDIICNDLKIVSGVVQMGMGGIMGLLGGIGSGIGAVVSGIGKLLKKLGARSAGKKLIRVGGDVSEAAGNMLENSKSMMVNGAKQFKEGLAGQLTVVKKLVTLDHLGDEEEEKKETVIDEERANKVNLSDAGANFGSGDVNNYNTWNYTYGSGNTMNQHTYGPTMNMAERGCGPVALADAYMRRTGSGMNPLTLAGAMMGNGSYEPNRGTSVASMVNTGRALGMNTQVGGVTQRSLNSASPSNPITVMGSGTGFGTKRGNDHYLNVVGSDGRGNSYVSNPLTGRVSKTPTSQLALNSRLGLYGSGDKLPDEFGIDLDSMTALERLQSLSERFQKIFTGDSTVDKTKKDIAAGKTANMSATLDAQLGDLTDEQQKAIIANAKKQYLEDHRFRAKRDGESDEDYNKAFEADFEKNGGNYINKAKQALLEERVQTSKDNAETDTASIQTGLEGISNMNKAMVTAAMTDDIEDDESSSGIGTFMSEKGVPLFNYGTPKYTDIRITDWMNASNHQSGHSPLHDFFGQMNDDVAYSADDNWYDGDREPDDTGEGQKLSDWRKANGEKHHGGIDINWIGGSDGKKAYATTGGKVKRADYSDSCGNNVIWTDSEGIQHWYMHLKEKPLVSEGETIEGGQLLGYVGNTGASGGSHLHYTITTDSAWSGDGIGEVNPIMYFSHFNPAAGSMAGDTMLQKMWSYLLGCGYSKEAIAGYLGFIAGESGGVPNGTSDINDINFDQGLGALFNSTGSADLKSLSAKMRESNEAYLSNINDYTKLAYSTWGGSPADTKGSDGIYYGDTGLSQWVSDSALGLINRAKDNGATWTDAATQIQHFEEKQMAPLKSKFANAKSLRDAFEIGGAYNAHSAYGWNQYDGQDDTKYGMRFKTAQAIYDAFKDADITQWTGYQATSSSTATKTSHTTRNRYAAAINGKEVDLSDIRYRKDVYIYYYQEAASTPGCDEARAYSEFTRYIRGIEKLAPFVTGDAKTLVTDDVVTQYAIMQVGEYNYNTHNLNLSGAPDAAREVEKRKENEYKKAYEQKVSDEESRCRNSLMDNPYMWAAVNTKDWEFMENSNVGSERDAGDGNEGLYGTVITETDPLNLREEPNTTSKVLATIASGIQIPITKTDDAAWYGTEYNNQHGYVSSKYINLIGDNSTGVTANHSFANVGNDNSTITVPKSTKTGTEQAVSKVFDPTRTKSLTVSARNIREWFTPSSLDESAVSDIGTNWSQMFNMYDIERISKQDLNYDGWIGFPNTMNKFAKALKGINYDDPSSKYYGTADDTGMTWSAEPSIIKSEQGPLRWQLLNYIDNMNDNTLSSINIKPDVGQMDYNTKTYKPKRVKLGELGNSGLIPNIGGLKNLKDAEIIDWVSGSGDVPALDMNQIFDDASQTMQNAAGAFGGNNVTNVIVRDDQATTDMITRLSEITFKVRNERVEELLEEIVDYIKSPKKKSSSTFNHVHGSNNYTIEDMFEDEIPEAVMRLSKGG